MRPIVTDRVTWSVGRSVCMLLCHTIVISAKTAEDLIEMPFALKRQVGPRNHVLDGGPDPPWEVTIVTGERGEPL